MRQCKNCGRAFWSRLLCHRCYFEALKEGVLPPLSKRALPVLEREKTEVLSLSDPTQLKPLSFRRSLFFLREREVIGYSFDQKTFYPAAKGGLKLSFTKKPFAIRARYGSLEIRSDFEEVRRKLEEKEIIFGPTFAIVSDLLMAASEGSEMPSAFQSDRQLCRLFWTKLPYPGFYVALLVFSQRERGNVFKYLVVRKKGQEFGFCIFRRAKRTWTAAHRKRGLRAEEIRNALRGIVRNSLGFEEIVRDWGLLPVSEDQARKLAEVGLKSLPRFRLTATRLLFRKSDASLLVEKSKL